MGLRFYRTCTHTHTHLNSYICTYIKYEVFECIYSFIHIFGTVTGRASCQSGWMCTDECNPPLVSPLGGVPHPVAVVSVEVGRHLVLLVQTACLHVVRKAQRLVGQRLHGVLNQLDVAASSCCVCLGEDGEENDSGVTVSCPALLECC